MLMLPLLSFMTLISRKFTDVEDISCVNLMDGTTLFRCSMKALRKSLFPFQIRNIYVIDETDPVNNMIIPLCTVNKSVFQSTDIHVSIIWCSSGTHGCTPDVYKIMAIKSDIIQFQYFV